MRVLICYRRNDTQVEAGRLFDDLVREFGIESVFFRDEARIEAGRDSLNLLDEILVTFDVLLVLIGPNWFDARDEVGRRLLDDPRDFVHLETAWALKRNVPVIPVLLRGAKMPHLEELPDDLKELAYRSAVELTHAYWSRDLQLLIETLHRMPPRFLVALSEDVSQTRYSAPPPKSAPLSIFSEPGLLARIRGWWARRKAQSVKPNVPKKIRVDNVHFTLTGPSVLTPAKAHELIFWVHVERQKGSVLSKASAAHNLSISDLSVKSEGPYPLKRGSCLSVRLNVWGLRCIDDHKWITWTGEIGSTGFVVEVPKDAGEGTHPGTASIKLDGLEIAKMSFVVCVGEAKPNVSEISSRTRKHRSAFASYATQDRVEVLSRIQGMEAAYKGLRVFVDVVDLRSGQNWEQELKKHISEADVFYLFWCRHASASEWVNKEWRLALTAKGEDFIDPIPLEAPRLAPPPQELAAKHFNDPLLAFIASAGGGHS